MYPLPQHNDLKFLINLKIFNVRVLDYTVIINFDDSSVEINGYNENFSVLDKVSCKNYPIADKITELLNHRITDYCIQSTNLCLIIDNNLIINLSADDQDYECFTISNHKTTFVV